MGNSLDSWDILEQDVPEIRLGWNTVELSQPVTINGGDLCVGIQMNYESLSGDFPMALIGNPFAGVRGSLFYKFEEELSWGEAGYSLCLQCLVEGSVPDYDIELIRSHDLDPFYYENENDYHNMNKYIRQGEDSHFTVDYIAKSIGKYVAERYTIGWQIDDGEIHYDNTERNINKEVHPDYLNYILPLDLPIGHHEVYVFVTSINGNPIHYSKERAIKIQHKVWSKDIGRQKTLIDFQTSGNHPNTYWDYQSIYKAREHNENISLLATLYDHNNVPLNMPYHIFEEKGFSWLAINRDALPGQSYFRLHLPTDDFDLLSKEIAMVSNTPSFATVNISASVNSQKELEIKVNGTRNEEFVRLFAESRLTVVLTEDSVEAKLNTTYGVDEKYKYDGILRCVLSSIWGDPMQWEDDNYEMIYKIKPAKAWNLQKVKIIAFISEKEYNYINASEVDVLNCNEIALKDLDLEDLEKEEDRVIYTIIAEGKVAAKMRDKNIQGDLIIPSKVNIDGKSYNVTEVSPFGFESCRLRSVVLPDGMEELGDYAFASSQLESIIIPSTVKTIGREVFSYCMLLQSITVEEESKYYAVRDNALIEVINGNNRLIAYPIGNGVQNYVIPEGVKVVENAFAGCSTLSSVTLSNSVTTLNGSFNSCSQLKSIIYSNPSSLKVIGISTFVACGLEEFVAPESLERLEFDAFVSCNRLKKISLEKSKIVELFSGFTNLSMLEELRLPRTLEYIVASASFENCLSMRRILVYNPNPAVVNGEFEGSIYNNTTLFVPRGSLEVYRNAPGWNKFTKIEEFDTSVNVVARNFERIYGEANPTFEYTVEGGLLEGKPEIICEATETSPVGEYPIVVKQGTVKNQNVSYIAGTLTVVKAPLTTIANSYMKKQYEPMPEFSVFYIGFKNNETKDVLTKQPVLSCEANEDSTPGEYTITVSGAEAENYEIQYIAGKLTVTEASYTLTYIVDGEVYQSISVKYRDSITPLEAPEKEGYTFSGWSEIPEIMPNHDVTVTGSFTANSYTLTYIVDGEEYKSFTIKYRDPITPLEAPTKEGYTFYGWDGLPRSMPAQNVTVTGYFTINTYTVMYVLDGEVYTTETLKYGAKIVPPVILGLEDYTIWEDVPETMPAFDITIYGKAKEIIDSLTPALSKSEGKVYDLSGRKINYQLSTFNSQFRKKGIYIIRMKDGTTRKELIK